MVVTREGGVIGGAVTAIAAADRMCYSLSSYTRLEKDRGAGGSRHGPRSSLALNAACGGQL